MNKPPEVEPTLNFYWSNHIHRQAIPDNLSHFHCIQTHHAIKTQYIPTSEEDSTRHNEDRILNSIKKRKITKLVNSTKSLTNFS